MPEIYSNNVFGHAETVTAGNTSDPVSVHGVRTLSIGVTPGSGGSGLVEFSLSSPEAVAGDTANWFEWPKGAVTEASHDAIIGPVTALRFTATTADCVFEVLGV